MSFRSQRSVTVMSELPAWQSPGPFFISRLTRDPALYVEALCLLVV